MDVTEKYSSVYGELQEIVQSSPKLVILGIGENRMGDDGLGQLITFELDKWSKYPQIRIINGGITPEERLDELIEFQGGGIEANGSVITVSNNCFKPSRA